MDSETSRRKTLSKFSEQADQPVHVLMRPMQQIIVWEISSAWNYTYFDPYWITIPSSAH